VSVKYYIYCTNQPDDVIQSCGIWIKNANGDFVKGTKTRQQIINDLDFISNNELDEEIRTWFKDTDGKWKTGAKVRKIWVGGKPYITTNWNETPKDNLDELQQC